MARATRMVLNRDALHEVDRALASGMELLAMDVLSEADPNVPDAAPYGEGLIDRGSWISYVDGRKVGQDQPGVKKPKAARVRGRGVAVFAGYSFPARFNEMGTVHQPPRPFLAPALANVVGSSSVVASAFERASADYLSGKARRLQRAFNLSPRALLR